MAIDKEVFDKAKDAMRNNSPERLNTANALLNMVSMQVTTKAMLMRMNGCSEVEIAAAIKPLTNFCEALVDYIDEKK